jgi:hypothetical protein
LIISFAPLVITHVPLRVGSRVTALKLPGEVTLPSFVLILPSILFIFLPFTSAVNGEPPSGVNVNVPPARAAVPLLVFVLLDTIAKE